MTQVMWAQVTNLKNVLWYFWLDKKGVSQNTVAQSMENNCICVYVWT